MTRPPWEVADVIRRAGNRFIERYRESLTWAQMKVLTAIERCRTAALGGHRDQCVRCGYQAISYNSCRNRHCPKCQTNAREKWLRARQQELLPVGYFHLVFSVPHALVPLMWQNQRVLFTLLFEASAATLLEVASDPKHLGAEIGFLSILHTWGQTLQRHPHVHCVVPGGGLSPDHAQWVSSRSHFFLPVKVLSRVFRGKFVAGLRRAFRQKKLSFHGACLPLSNEKAFTAFLRTLFREGLGGLRQATFWRAGTRAAVSGSVHAPGSNLEPSNRRRQRCPRDVPLEGLRPSQQAPYDELNPRGVPAPLPAACPAQGFPSYSLLRILGQPPARGVSVAMPHAISACAARSADGFRNRSGPLVLSLLPGTDARDRTAYGGTDPARRKQTGLHP